MPPRHPISLTPRIRFALSVLLIGHLIAVVAPPLSFQARGPVGLSPVVASLLAPVEGYAQSLYIDRGYAFFAPDPGPSHLIQAAITSKDGTRIERIFPDLNDQWPRLLYHRHFMLSEFLTEIYQPPGPPPELAAIDRAEAEDWVRARARYEHIRQSIVKHLKSEYPGQDVAIRRIEHLIPEREPFLQRPIPLDDPQLYRVLLDQPVDLMGNTPDTSGDLIAPKRPPETVPPPKAEPESQATPEAPDQSQPSTEEKPSTDAEPSPDVAPTGTESASRLWPSLPNIRLKIGGVEMIRERDLS